MKHRIFRLLILGVVILTTVSASAYDARIDGIYYNLNSNDKTASVTEGPSTYNNYAGDIVIPCTIWYNNITYSVTNIENHAFQSSSNLSSIVIPNSVTSIGSYAFDGCSNLSSVSIPNSVTSIGGSAFYGCISLTSITIPEAITSIENNTFYDCSKLSTINIPKNVKNIGSYAFANCYNLTSINIPTSVTNIGSNAFSGCFSLTSIYIPNSVTTIEDYAFSSCSNATSCIIGSSVSSIGDYAFMTCSSLNTVICYATEVPLASVTAFRNVSSATTLYVPAESVNLYKSTAPWSVFKTIEPIHEQCAAPVITFEDGKIIATSETEGAECKIECSWSGNISGTNIVYTTIKLHVNAYAIADGYDKSATTTMEIDLMNYASGDINGDGKINVEDITKIVQKALAK